MTACIAKVVFLVLCNRRFFRSQGVSLRLVGGSGDCASRSTLRAPVHLPPPQLAFRLALEARCLLGPSRALKQDLSASLPQLLRCARPGRERWRQRARRPRCPFFEIYRVSPRTALEQISENAFRCGRTLKKTTPLGLFFTSQTLFLIPRLPSFAEFCFNSQPA